MSLNSAGFDRPNAQKITDDLIKKYKAEFGEDASVSTHSAGGILIRILSYLTDAQNQDIEAIYNSQFVSSATGVSLEKLANNMGLQRLPQTRAQALLRIEGIKDTGIGEGTLFKTPTGITFALGGSVVIPESGVVEEIGYAVEMGSKGNVSRDTIVIQGNPMDAITSVTNPNGAFGGADLETDAQLRDRIELATQSSQTSSIKGLVSAINKVNGNSSARVVENHLMEELNGQPPKSINIIVSGGSDPDIAQAIFENVAAGVTTWGQKSYIVEDLFGHPHEVFWDEVSDKTIYFEVEVETDDSYSMDGDKLIAEQLVEFINSVSIGNKIILTKAYDFIYNVPGVSSATVLIGTSPDNVSNENIQLTKKEAARTEEQFITVNHP